MAHLGKTVQFAIIHLPTSFHHKPLQIFWLISVCLVFRMMEILPVMKMSDTASHVCLCPVRQKDLSFLHTVQMIFFFFLIPGSQLTPNGNVGLRSAGSLDFPCAQALKEKECATAAPAWRHIHFYFSASEACYEADGLPV